jgi:hypothetical protein
MTMMKFPRPRAILAVLLSLTLCGAAAAASPPGTDAFNAATEHVREVLREDQADSTWGADLPEKDVAARGEPFAVIVLSGAGHSLLAFDSEGRPIGSHLHLLHVVVEGSLASVTECALRLGKDGDRSCPPAPMAVVDCKAWSVPVETVHGAMLAARAALFVRVYEKKFIPGPREEILHDGPISVSGGIPGGSTGDFVAAVSVMESREFPVRVSEEWAGYPSASHAGAYARALAAVRILWGAFERRRDTPVSTPPPAVDAEFSRLLATLPLDSGSWWWVRERMVLMAASLGLPADLARLEKYVTQSSGSTRSYALEALARRTQRDTRCKEGQRLDNSAAAAAWKR